MSSIESLTNQLTYARRQKAFAWAKYYEQVNTTLHDDHRHFTTYTETLSNDAIPEHIKTQLKEMATALQKKWQCPICFDMIDDGDLDITNCGHYYCKPCLTHLKHTHKTEGRPRWECAVCRRKHGYKEDDE